MFEKEDIVTKSKALSLPKRASPGTTSSFVTIDPNLASEGTSEFILFAADWAAEESKALIIWRWSFYKKRVKICSFMWDFILFSIT